MSSSVSHDLQKLIAENFKGYEYPHETTQTMIRKMRRDEQDDYYAEASRIFGGKVWKTEMEGLLRHYFTVLAFQADSEKKWSEMDAYRLTVLVIQDLGKRMQSLAAMAKSPHRKISDEMDAREGIVRIKETIDKR